MWPVEQVCHGLSWSLTVWLFLATSPRYRSWLRRKEPYVMLAIGMAGFSPVIFWNLYHGAVSLKHVMGQADSASGASPAALP